jgi:hypothetical protein
LSVGNKFEEFVDLDETQLSQISNTLGDWNEILKDY